MRVFASVLLFAALASCSGAQNAAQRDPMRCERDPRCGRARSAATDCTLQCNDNPECVDRCREAEVDRMGHP
jgi:hypothetical protein